MITDKLKKAIKYAGTLSVSVNVLGLMVSLLFSGMDKALADYKVIAPLTLALFFVPCFIAVYCFNKQYFKNYKTFFISILKVGFASFLIIYVSVYLLLSYLHPVGPSFWNIVSLMNGIIAIFISIFCTLAYYLVKGKQITKDKFAKADLSKIKLLLIWLITSILYLVISTIGSSTGFTITYFMSLLFLGLFSVGLTYNILHKETSAIGQTVLLMVDYSINVLVFPLLVLIVHMWAFGITLSPETIISGITIISPYFLFLTLFIHFYHASQANKTSKEALRQVGVKANLQYQQLKSQLSPHFLFNNISVLTALIEEAPKRAVQFSESLANIYRYFLAQEKQDLVPLKEELIFADHYVNLLKVRYENALTYASSVSDIPNLYVLPLALQQVFENVTKHNEISFEKPININISLEKDYLVVENTINLKKVLTKNDPIGLKNIGDRYAYFTNKKVIIDHGDTYYTIKLPLLQIEEQ